VANWTNPTSVTGITYVGYPLRSGAHYILWFWARRLFPAHEA
jgi:hypothetical protein